MACRYTDLLGEYSAGLYGHSEPILVEAIRATLHENGSNLGANTKHEIRYASLICERFSLDTVRFTNSGTEANLHALMAARHFTGKQKVVVFTGGYHGSVLGFSTKPMANTVDQQSFVVVEYNNIPAAQIAIEQTPDVGAVLIEGMQGASGNIVGTDDFLLAVQASARKVFLCTRQLKSSDNADLEYPDWRSIHTRRSFDVPFIRRRPAECCGSRARSDYPG